MPEYTFKIDKGIPIPSRSYGGSRQGSKPRYPFAETEELGDSFFCPASVAAEHKVRAAASAFKKNHPEYNFVVLQVIEDDTPGVRVWRIESISS